MNKQVPGYSIALLPLSWLYGFVVCFRNWLFDKGVLTSWQPPVPTILVGNLTVGGTGKTPHVEYLVRLLNGMWRMAVVSRGYKRKTKGFVLATSDTRMEEIGDEPWQVKHKFPEVHVAVDANRHNAIERVLDKEDVQVVVMDDAFQHRYVKAGLSILLMDYCRPIYDDMLLPAGRLREPVCGKKRADVVIVTKCPADLSVEERSEIEKKLNLDSNQQLYFSRLCYGDAFRLDKTEERVPLKDLRNENILLLTAIGNPKQMLKEVSQECPMITPLTFADHHNFTKGDIEQLRQIFERLAAPRRILTTEKDAARLLSLNYLTEDLRKSIYVLPIEVEFMYEKQEMFNNKILSYVRKD